MFANKLTIMQLDIPLGIFRQPTPATYQTNNWLYTNVDNQDQIRIYTTHLTSTLQVPFVEITLPTKTGTIPYSSLINDLVNGGSIGKALLSAPKRIPKSEIITVREIVEHNLKQCPTDIYTLLTLQKYRKQLKITLLHLNQWTGMSWKIHRTDTEWVLPKYVNTFNPAILISAFLNMDLEVMNQRRTEPEPMKILPYSTKADQVFNVKTNTDKPLIGIELELEPATQKTQAEAYHYTYPLLKHHCIIKSDGSVYNGFEIVSKPAIWTEQLKEWGPWFEKLNEFMLAKANCGMHIHMNRRSLSFLQLAKLVEFINREENTQYITYVAGRKPNTYCILLKENNISSVGRNLNNNIQTFGTRHVGLNLTNQKTIEFRMFAATTNLDTFQKNIEFVVALRDYFTPGNSTLHPKEQTHFSKFMEWVRQPRNKKMYSKLHQHNLAFNPT